MSTPAKRFYKAVNVDTQDDGLLILLDGRPLRSPAKHALPLPSDALAQAVAAEWDAQGEQIDPQSMPLMKLVSTMADRVTPQRSEIIRETARFAETDLVCHRAEPGSDLRARQDALWQPVLDWAGVRHGMALTVCEGILPADQPPEALAAAETVVSSQDDARLTALQAATQGAASLVLGLALLERQSTAAELYAAAHVDETFQAETWGTDPAAEARLAQVKQDLEGVEVFLSLL